MWNSKRIMKNILSKCFFSSFFIYHQIFKFLLIEMDLDACIIQRQQSTSTSGHKTNRINQIQKRRTIEVNDVFFPSSSSFFLNRFSMAIDKFHARKRIWIRWICVCVEFVVDPTISIGMSTFRSSLVTKIQEWNGGKSTNAHILINSFSLSNDISKRSVKPFDSIEHANNCDGDHHGGHQHHFVELSSTRLPI